MLTKLKRRDFIIDTLGAAAGFAFGYFGAGLGGSALTVRTDDGRLTAG